MINKVSLVMTYHKRSGRWFIKTAAAPSGPTLQFPDDERIEALWSENVPGSSLSMGNLLSGPALAFYVDIGGGSTRVQRQKFLDALLSESPIAPPATPTEELVYMPPRREPPTTAELDALCET